MFPEVLFKILTNLINNISDSTLYDCILLSSFKHILMQENSPSVEINL